MMNKLQWNFNHDTAKIFLQENYFENLICKWQPFCFGHHVLKRLVWGYHKDMDNPDLVIKGKKEAISAEILETMTPHFIT